MMETAYFLLMIILVGWLMVWAVLPDHLAARLWSPFDMRDDPPGVPAGQDAGDGPAPAPGGSWRARAARREARGSSKGEAPRRVRSAP
jgi:hypothetical protein